MDTQTVDRLQKLGFKTAGDKVKKAAEKKRKLAIAYEHYRFVKQEKIDAFNAKLRKKTEKRESYTTTWQTLAFTPVKDYAEVPPEEVLEKMEEAIDKNCFDVFEVAYIETMSQTKVPDPILFGRINGCPDRFFISQWDDDVKIEDILSAKEG